MMLGALLHSERRSAHDPHIALFLPPRQKFEKKKAREKKRSTQRSRRVSAKARTSSKSRAGPDDGESTTSPTNDGNGGGDDSGRDRDLGTDRVGSGVTRTDGSRSLEYSKSTTEDRSSASASPRRSNSPRRKHDDIKRDAGEGATAPIIDRERERRGLREVRGMADRHRAEEEHGRGNELDRSRDDDENGNKDRRRGRLRSKQLSGESTWKGGRLSVSPRHQSSNSADRKDMSRGGGHRGSKERARYDWGRSGASNMDAGHRREDMKRAGMNNRSVSDEDPHAGEDGRTSRRRRYDGKRRRNEGEGTESHGGGDLASDPPRYDAKSGKSVEKHGRKSDGNKSRQRGDRDDVGKHGVSTSDTLSTATQKKESKRHSPTVSGRNGNTPTSTSPDNSSAVRAAVSSRDCNRTVESLDQNGNVKPSSKVIYHSKASTPDVGDAGGHGNLETNNEYRIRVGVAAPTGESLGENHGRPEPVELRRSQGRVAGSNDRSSPRNPTKGGGDKERPIDDEFQVRTSSCRISL